MNCVFITGATGVIGSELVPLFLDSGDFNVRLLIRAKSPEHLRERMQELYAYWEKSPKDEGIRGRLEAMCGDVCLPKLGLADAAYDRLAAEVTHIVHSAGNVKLNQTIDEARRNALDPARRLVALARACQQQGQLRKFDAVTTIGVAGRMPGLIPERSLSEPREFHNNYERAKAETEDYLLQELAAGLPLTIHRPSMVVGRSDNGKVFRKQVFYYLCEFLSGRKTGGFLPEFGNAALDIIPVDYVARAIHLAATQPDSVGRIFHLCTGPDHALRLKDLVARVRSLAADRGEKLPGLRYLPNRWFDRIMPLARMVTWGRTRRAIANLPFFLAYLAESQSFATAESTGYFAPRNVQVPAVAEYLASLLEHE